MSRSSQIPKPISCTIFANIDREPTGARKLHARTIQLPVIEDIDKLRFMLI